MNYITIRNLHKSFPVRKNEKLHVLKGVDLDVEQGEIFGVIGPSGAGKSTLIRCINLLEAPSSGSVIINGQEMTTLPLPELLNARRKIGMIFQHFNLLSSRTVARNIAFPLEISHTPQEQIDKRVAELLELVDLSDKADVFPAQLSGGQKQRVGIARALATQPDILLSDEATSALDPQTRISILNLLKDLNQKLGLTILLITHEMEVVKQICDRVAIMEDGCIVEQGRLTELVAKPNSTLSRAFFPPGDLTAITPGAANVTISFLGNSASEPVLSHLVKSYNVDVNILGGSIQKFGEQRIGKLQVEISGEQVDSALEYLRNEGLGLELHQ